MGMKANPHSSRPKARKIARRSPRFTRTKGSRGVTNPVTGRYCLRARVGGNRTRLWAIVRLFQISPSDIAEATGFSRPYIARLLSPKDDLEGSSDFFRILEQKLGTIIEGRTAQFFVVPAVSVQRVRAVMELGQVNEPTVGNNKVLSIHSFVA